VNVDDKPRLGRVELFRHPERGALLGTPGGGLFRVPLPVEQLRALLSDCTGTASFGELAELHPLDGTTAQVLDSLLQLGCVTVGDLVPCTPPNLLLLGDEPLIDLVDATSFGTRRVLRDKDDLASVDAASSVLLVLHDRLNQAELLAIGSRCRPHGLRWTHFHLENGKGWFGPHVEHGRSPDVDDLFIRRRTAAADRSLLEALDSPVVLDGRPLPPDAELRWMVATAVLDTAHWTAGAPARAAWHEVELDPLSLSTTRHPVLPLDEVEVPAFVGDHPHDWLVDERTGIVRGLTDVRHHPSIPRVLTTVHARVSDISRVSPWRNDPVAGGSAFGDRVAAANAAVGEAVERYCGNIVQEHLLTKASFTDLVRSGQRAVDPDTLVLFSEGQYNAPGFPFNRFTRDLPVHWVRGRSITRDEPAWLPASMVYANWYTPTFAADPPTNPTFFPGIAAGTDLDSAIAAGLEEVVERHTTMTWWLNAAPLPAARQTTVLNGMWTGDGEQRRWLIPLDNEFGVPVMAGCVEHRQDRVLTIGFAMRPDPLRASLKAWTEALTLQDIARDLLVPHGAYRKAVGSGRLNPSGVKPWREDRRYLDDYRSDFRDVVDLTAQVQVHLDPRAQDLIRPWIEAPAERDLPPALDQDLRGVVEAAGYEVFCADITTPDVRAAGLRVARTLVPGLVPNSAAAFPHLGRDVVRNTAVKLGWRGSPFAESDLNLVPMPHA
jgi:ribosomal protein S12 methylthiotransferase accessory factor